MKKIVLGIIGLGLVFSEMGFSKSRQDSSLVKIIQYSAEPKSFLKMLETSRDGVQCEKVTDKNVSVKQVESLAGGIVKFIATVRVQCDTYGSEGESLGNLKIVTFEGTGYKFSEPDQASSFFNIDSMVIRDLQN